MHSDEHWCEFPVIELMLALRVFASFSVEDALYPAIIILLLTIKNSCGHSILFTW